jgi:plasmid maintenance system antidote protein VapI
MKSNKDIQSKNLRLLMWDNRIRQKDIAAVLGLTTATISKFVNGKSPMGAEHLIKLNEVYGVSADWLLMDQGEMYLDEQTAA